MTMQDPDIKHLTKKRVMKTTKDMPAGQKGKEEKMKDFFFQEKAAALSDHETRVLRTKLYIMQEELDLLSAESRKKDDEIAQLRAKSNELEDERASLQRTIKVQETQIEEQKSSVQKFVQRCDDLELRVYGLSKLLRCYEEEVEKMNCQLSETKQTKNMKNEKQPNVENLLAENRILKRQKSELVVGFRKQNKLIDILKRQMMHLEAAKLLSFTEEEFIKAMDMETQ